MTKKEKIERKKEGKKKTKKNPLPKKSTMRLEEKEDFCCLNISTTFPLKKYFPTCGFDTPSRPHL